MLPVEGMVITHFWGKVMKTDIGKSLDDLPYTTRQQMGLIAFIPVITDS